MVQSCHIGRKVLAKRKQSDFLGRGIPQGGNREVSPFGRFKEGSGEGNRNPSPGALSPISGASEMGPPEAAVEINNKIKSSGESVKHPCNVIDNSSITAINSENSAVLPAQAPIKSADFPRQSAPPMPQTAPRLIPVPASAAEATRQASLDGQYFVPARDKPRNPSKNSITPPISVPDFQPPQPTAVRFWMCLPPFSGIIPAAPGRFPWPVS